MGRSAKFGRSFLRTSTWNARREIRKLYSFLASANMQRTEKEHADFLRIANMQILLHDINSV